MTNSLKKAVRMYNEKIFASTWVSCTCIRAHVSEDAQRPPEDRPCSSDEAVGGRAHRGSGFWRSAGRRRLVLFLFTVVFISGGVLSIAAALPQQGQLQLPALHLPQSWASVCRGKPHTRRRHHDVSSLNVCTRPKHQ